MINAAKSLRAGTIPEETIHQIVNQVIELIHPLRVILFGSLVWNRTHADSDVDLLVVVPEGTHRRKTAQFLYQHIAGIKTPFDIVVATPGDLERHKDNPGLIYKTVLREGKEVYAA